MTAAVHQPEVADEPLPVSVARDGFTPAQAADLLKRYDYMETLEGGNVALFFALNVNQSLSTASVARAGDVVMLEQVPDPAIGRTRLETDLGNLSLTEYLAHPQSRAQGMIVVHRGRIAFEEYPGMRDFDYKMWMSNAKTTTSLVIALLAEEGKIDVTEPVDRYLPALHDTDWAGTRVLDVLDMASGMNIHETQEHRLDPHSIIARVNFAFNGLSLIHI